MALDYFRHQGIHRATARGDGVQDLGALGFLIERAFDGFHLPLYAPDAIQQFLFLFDRVGHKIYAFQAYPSFRVGDAVI